MPVSTRWRAKVDLPIARRPSRIATWCDAWSVKVCSMARGQ